MEIILIVVKGKECTFVLQEAFFKSQIQFKYEEPD
jgi:hypothetical protein